MLLRSGKIQIRQSASDPNLTLKRLSTLDNRNSWIVAGHFSRSAPLLERQQSAGTALGGFFPSRDFAFFKSFIRIDALDHGEYITIIYKNGEKFFEAVIDNREHLEQLPT